MEELLPPYRRQHAPGTSAPSRPAPRPPSEPRRSRHGVRRDSRAARGQRRSRSRRSRPGAGSSPATRCCRSPGCWRACPSGSGGRRGCMNAASEIEAVNMTLGAAAAGARAGTGSCGQGVALMQEAIAEAALNRDAVRGVHHGPGPAGLLPVHPRRRLGRLPHDHAGAQGRAEAAEHTQLAFHLADLHRAPTIVYGDYLIAQTHVGVEVAPRDFGPLPAKDWALDGSRGGTGRSRVMWPGPWARRTTPGSEPDGHWRAMAEKFDADRRGRGAGTSAYAEDADVLVVSFGSAAVRRTRGRGAPRRGASDRLVPPDQLWPFPEQALRRRDPRQAGAGLRGQRRPDARRRADPCGRPGSGVVHRRGEHTHESGMRLRAAARRTVIAERVRAHLLPVEAVLAR